MPDKLRSVDRLLPLKPKVLHILLAVADGPRHGYSIMQEVAERTDGQVRLWPAALYGLLRELEKTRFDRGVGQPTGRRRRRRAASVLRAHAAREARAGCRGAAPRSDCQSRPLEPCVAKGGSRMTASIGVPSAKTANDCSNDGSRARAASPSRRPGSRCSGISSSSEPGTISHRHCGRSFDRRQSRSASHSSSDLVSRRRPHSSRLSTRCCFDRFPTINPIGSS